MPPTPQQSSHSSLEAMQWQTEMEVQGSSWNARERTVIAKMEQYLNESDCMKLEIEELELLLGPEDSEVNLRYILRNASRRGGRIFEIFNSKEKSEHLVASKVRWDERQRLKVAQEERARRDVQEVDDEVDHNWIAACEWTTEKMLKYLEDSEVMKVSTRELKEQVLAPDESSVNMVRIARQARSEKGRSCFRFSDKERTRSSSPVWRDGRSN